MYLQNDLFGLKHQDISLHVEYFYTQDTPIIINIFFIIHTVFSWCDDPPPSADPWARLESD